MTADWRLRLQKVLYRRGNGGPSDVSPSPDEVAMTSTATAELGLHAEMTEVSTEQIPVESIRANPYQPRTEINEEALRGLADSIRQHGLLQPVLVRPLSGGGFELVAGQRRLRAARLLGLRTIAASVLNATPDEAGLLALVENIQREDLNFMEEAAAYERLLRDFGMTQENLASRLGKAQSTIANKLRLLHLPSAVRARIEAGAFSERHARALLSLGDEARQLAVADAVEADGLTVRQTEALVERMASESWEAGTPRRRKGARSWRGVFNDVRILSNTFRAATEQLRAAGMQVELSEMEREQGLEIRVLVHLPAGWRTTARRREQPE
jgi:ParB family chromosome partitioning protein